MSDLEKAAREAVAAADNTELVRQVAALLASQQAQQAQQAQQPVRPASTPVQQRPYGLYVAAGISGAVALSFLAMAAALLAVAVAVGAVCATVCLLVLRSLLRDMQKGR